MEKLTNENYFSQEMGMKYMGYSQFKRFMECEYEALAMVKGEYSKPKTTALLIGSYVDAHFSNELEEFKMKNPEIFKKDGTLKSEFEKAEEIIRVYEEDELCKKYWSGDTQAIMTGVIAGVPFKIKVDSYFPGKLIVDGKVMKDMEPVWVEMSDPEGHKYNVKKNFWDAYGYQIEGAIYQEIVNQNERNPESPYFISKDAPKLPFVLNVVTKETIPNKELIRIDQDILDDALNIVIENAPRFDKIKKGEIEPTKCGHCDWCRMNKKLTGVKSVRSLENYIDIEQE